MTPGPGPRGAARLKAPEAGPHPGGGFSKGSFTPGRPLWLPRHLFAGFLTRLRHPGDAQLVAAKLLDLLSRPYALSRMGATVHVFASAGVAVTPQAGPDLGTLQRCADEAMYVAKRQGRRPVCLYVLTEGTPAP